jgi:RNA-directed DNA polymerase
MYNSDLWKAWVQQEMKNYQEDSEGRKIYLKKGYLHLDHKIWFPDEHTKLEKLIKDRLMVIKPQRREKEFYSFSPFLKVLAKTPRYRYQSEEGYYDLETKIRPLCYAAHKDSLILGYYSFALTKKYEEYIKKQEFDETVLAYRTDLGKCNIQFAKDAFEEVKVRKTCSVIALDIKGYFDHIDHKILLDKWQKVIGGRLPEDQFRLFQILTRYHYINQKNLLKTYKGPKTRNDRLPSTLMDLIPGNGLNEKFRQLKRDQLIVDNSVTAMDGERYFGIPQGSPISALLSNIYLIDFDEDLKKKSVQDGFYYRRYCDDILIVCDSDKALEVMDYLVDKISREYFLTIQPQKVDLIDFQKNSNGKIRGFRRPRRMRKKSGVKDTLTISDRPAAITAANEDSYYRSLQYLGFEFNGKNVLIRSSSLSRYFWKLNYRLQRTVIMSYSPKSKDDQIFLRQIYERYSHLGGRNFLTYAYKAAKKFYKDSEGNLVPGLSSPAIKRQLRNHFAILRHELEQKNIKWFSHKSKRNKPVSLRYFK